MTSLGVSLAAGIAALFTVVVVRYVVRSLAWVPRCERWHRSTRGLCPACGYDLTGNASGTCPECGTRIERPVPAPAGLSILPETQPWWVWAIVAATMLLAVIVERLR